MRHAYESGVASGSGTTRDNGPGGQEAAALENMRRRRRLTREAEVPVEEWQRCDTRQRWQHDMRTRGVQRDGKAARGRGAGRQEVVVLREVV